MKQQTNGKHPLSANIMDNIEKIQNMLSDSPDLTIRSFQTRGEEHVTLVYLSNLNNKPSIQDQILRPLMFQIERTADLTNEDVMVPIGNVDKITSWEEVKDSIFGGKSILFIDGMTHALTFGTQEWPQRAIQEPQIETSLKGSHQGFVEAIEQNLALVRRYITDENLVVRPYSVGKRAKSKVFLLYIQDVANDEYVQELTSRVQNIKKDAVLDLGEMQELIEDNPYTVFPQLLFTERPDTVASNLLQGRVVLLMDHSPNALIAPMTLVSFLQSQDDYSSNWIIASFIRLLRFGGLFIATSLPALYIAIISFHYEVIPLDLMLSIGASRSQVPFPPIIEAIIMEIAIEMIREAGIRLPSPVGQTIGVVGGIVIGEAAVQAGIVSNIMVIVVAVTAINGFIIPNIDMSNAIRIVRFPLMILSSLFGIVGLSVGLIMLSAHIISLKSLGAPFASSFAPIHFSDWKDTFFRAPMQKMRSRPFSVKAKQSRRQGEDES